MLGYNSQQGERGFCSHGGNLLIGECISQGSKHDIPLYIFKELAYMIVGAGKSEICSAGLQAVNAASLSQNIFS